jgi:type VI secretion system protein ImpA
LQLKKGDLEGGRPLCGIAGFTKAEKMSDQIIDIESLLAPLSEENPTGEELSMIDLGGPFLRAKDAFSEARKLVKEQQDKLLSGGFDSHGEPWRLIPAVDWTAIVNLTSSTLASVSKDFRFAGWLTEALLRKHGLAGLNEGLLLCKGLCERYWDNIHPVPTKEDGHGATVSAFASLVSDSTHPAIRATVIVEGTKANERSVRRYTASDYTRAKEAKGQVANANADTKIVELPDFLAISEVTPPEFHAKNLAIVNSCISTLDWLGDFLRTQCLPDEYDEPTNPGIVGMKTELQAVKKLIVELSGGNIAGEAVSEETVGGSQANSSAGGQMTRESAFRTIEEIARFFERTEPHTPVHFALRKVVRWGRMPLPQLLAELIEDGGAMESLRKLIGLPEENQSGS